MSYKKQELLSLSEQLISPPVFGRVGVAKVLLIFFMFLCCFYACFVCPRPVSYVPNVDSVSGLSILYYPFRFL